MYKVLAISANQVFWTDGKYNMKNEQTPKMLIDNLIEQFQLVVLEQSEFENQYESNKDWSSGKIILSNFRSEKRNKQFDNGVTIYR